MSYLQPHTRNVIPHQAHLLAAVVRIPAPFTDDASVPCFQKRHQKKTDFSSPIIRARGHARVVKLPDLVPVPRLVPEVAISVLRFAEHLCARHVGSTPAFSSKHSLRMHNATRHCPKSSVHLSFYLAALFLNSKNVRAVGCTTLEQWKCAGSGKYQVGISLVLINLRGSPLPVNLDWRSTGKML